MKVKVQKANIISDLMQPMLRLVASRDPSRYYFRLFGYDVFIVREKHERN